MWLKGKLMHNTTTILFAGEYRSYALFNRLVVWQKSFSSGLDNYGTRTSKVFSAFRVTVKQASLDAMHASTVRSYALFNRLVNS